MASAGEALRDALQQAAGPLRRISEEQSARRPARGGWSAREILGHLIDSAANNHRRFVLAQNQDELIFPGYEQESWVALQRYQDESWESLLSLWEAYNRHLAHVMMAASPAERDRPRERHRLHEIAFGELPPGQMATLEWLMQDYVDHLQHHLQQILGV